MRSIVEALVDFAETGRIGRLRVGLVGEELDAALGDVGIDYDPELADRFSDYEGNVEAHVRDGVLNQLGLEAFSDGTFRLPRLLDATGSTGPAPESELVAALDARGLTRINEPLLTSEESHGIWVEGRAGRMEIVFRDFPGQDERLAYSLYWTHR